MTAANQAVTVDEPTVAARLLEVENLTVSLATRQGHRNAVDGVSFGIDRGAILGLAGESGSGKTMTAMAMLGLLPHGARVPAARSGWRAPSCARCPSAGCATSVAGGSR